MEEFYRINKLFNPDDATCLVKPSDLSKSDALYWYGIIMQGSYGDNKSVAPSWFSLVDRLKWNSYENQKGTDKH
jgi:acyl-CoA-binding protein